MFGTANRIESKYLNTNRAMRPVLLLAIWLLGCWSESYVRNVDLRGLSRSNGLVEHYSVGRVVPDPKDGSYPTWRGLK